MAVGKLSCCCCSCAPQALKAARDEAAACEQALKAAERQLGELEAAVPRARLEAEAEATKAKDIQQRLDELRVATQVGTESLCVLPGLTSSPDTLARPPPSGHPVAAYSFTPMSCMLTPATVANPAGQVSADDMQRIGELEAEVGRQEEALKALRVQTAGLEAKAAALQAKIDNAGERLLNP